MGEEHLAEIDGKFYRNDKDPDRVISETTRAIGGYIRAIGKEFCDEALIYDSREEIKFHLGAERRSSISWYPFKKDAVVLEVGGEFGAITGELCDKAAQVVVTEPSFFRTQIMSERYRNRTNLKIFAGDVTDMEFQYKFDYIVIIGMIDKIGNHTVANGAYVRAFEHLQKFLKEDGKFLLADENLFCIWKCQNSEGALNPWNHVRCLNKKQIISILNQSGIPYVKFYYPLPGYNLVGRVYSDEALPTAAEWNCLANFNCADQNFLAVNMDLFTRLTENDMFPHLAPAFFIEAGRVDNLSKMKKADVLFDDGYELPLLGFDWMQHGYCSLPEAIEKYRIKMAESVDSLEEYEKQAQLKAAVLHIDQDHEVIEEVMEVQLDLLRKLKQVCDDHGLKLFAMYGTLLGAIRNGGIIAGDDDIDVALFREDYNKLLALENEFQEQYFLQTPANDDCFYGGYLKLRNRNTTAIHPQNWWVNCCEGIAIDIFPIDSGFTDSAKEKKKQKKIRYLQRLLYAKAYGYFPDFMDMKLLRWKFYKYLGKFFSKKQLVERLNYFQEDTDGSKNAPFGVYAHYLGRREPRWLDREAFKEATVLSYEDVELFAPAGWDKILRKLYGDNYMESIPWHEGKQRHGFYDTKRMYQTYKERFRGIFRPEPSSEKKIVLFGDGILYEEYFRKYGNKYVPSEIVSLTDSVAEKQVHGIRVKTISEFLQSTPDNIYPIVCAIDIRRALEKMKKTGIDKYYIFLKERYWILFANYTFALNELKK